MHLIASPIGGLRITDRYIEKLVSYTSNNNDHFFIHHFPPVKAFKGHPFVFAKLFCESLLWILVMTFLHFRICRTVPYHLDCGGLEIWSYYFLRLRPYIFSSIWTLRLWRSLIFGYFWHFDFQCVSSFSITDASTSVADHPSPFMTFRVQCHCCFWHRSFCWPCLLCHSPGSDFSGQSIFSLWCLCQKNIFSILCYTLTVGGSNISRSCALLGWCKTMASSVMSSLT